MSTTTNPSIRRQRGHYSRLICLRCRARKIRCVLPSTDDAITPSPTAQPTHLACQRCRDNGYDCIVDKTVLGRPAQRPRQLHNAAGNVSGPAGDVHNERTANDGNTQKYLLSRPYDDSGEKMPPQEVCEALSSPLRFLAVLLSRHQTFARGMRIHAYTPASPVALVSQELAKQLDDRLIWHRIYRPYIPSLLDIRVRLSTSTRPRTSSILLFSLLCLLALETYSPPLPSLQLLGEALSQMVAHHGQAVLFNPPIHHDTVTALQLLAEYRPLALVTSPLAIHGSLTDGIYLSTAKRIAKRLGLDVFDISSLASGSTSPLDCLQWIHILTTSNYANFTMCRDDYRPVWREEFKPCIEVLEVLLTMGEVPHIAYWLTFSFLIDIELVDAQVAIIQCWRDLQALERVVLDHQAACIRRQDECKAILAALEPTFHDIRDAISFLVDSTIHNAHLSIIMAASFHAVMAAVHIREQPRFIPEEVTELNNHITTQLQTPPKPNDIHTFLAKVSEGVADDLNKQLTNFIALCDISVHGVSFQPSIKAMAGEGLYAAYHLVQQNAARLKGWGAMRDQVDDDITVMLEASCRLEKLTSGSVEEGDLMAGAALLMKELYSVLSTWRKRLAEQSRAIPSSTASAFQVSNPNDMVCPAVQHTTGPWDDCGSEGQPFNFASTSSSSINPNTPLPPDGGLAFTLADSIGVHKAVPAAMDPASLATHLPNSTGNTTATQPSQGGSIEELDFSSWGSSGPSFPDDFFASWHMWPQPDEMDFSQFVDFDYDPTGEAECAADEDLAG